MVDGVKGFGEVDGSGNGTVVFVSAYLVEAVCDVCCECEEGRGGGV